MIKKDDDYFCGIRADHFVIEVGFSEHRQGLIYLITANHKGNRCVTMIEENHKDYRGDSFDKDDNVIKIK